MAAEPLITAELPDLPLGVLVAGALDLMERTRDLEVQPCWLSVSDAQHFSVQFPPEPSSIPALVTWLERFGGTIVSQPGEGRNGPDKHYRVQFSFYGVEVTAYAIIPDAKVEHAGSPHTPGSLFDCPACEAQCHCAPGAAECVYAGQHNLPAS